MNLDQKFASVDECLPHLWFGFEFMENTAFMAQTAIPRLHTLEELLSKGLPESEAREYITSTHSFPRVPQLLYPSKRIDGKEGHFLHLTQLPFDIEVDEYTALSLDYHIAIHFDGYTENYSKETILGKVESRLKHMNIGLGTLIKQTIIVYCHRVTTHFSGMVKIHLAKPEVDGIELLSGKRCFILHLDNNRPFLGKVEKSYDPPAASGKVSTKIVHPSLKNVEGQALMRSIIIESFGRNLDYEIAKVGKKFEENIAWITTTSVEALEKITKFKIPFENELITPGIVIRGTSSSSKDDVAKRICLTLIARNLNKLRTKEETKEGLLTAFGPNNIVSIYFPDKDGEDSPLHTISANIVCLNAITYKMWVDKSKIIQKKCVEFTPHPKSLNGNYKPSEEELKRLGFEDVHQAMANTLAVVRATPHITPPPPLPWPPRMCRLP